MRHDEVHSKEHAPSQIIGVEFGQIHGRILEAALRIDHAEGTLLFARTSLVGERLEIDRAGDVWMVIAIPNKHRIYSGPGSVEVVRSPVPF